MKRIVKIVDSQTLMDEYKSIIVNEKSLRIYNGKVGMIYGERYVGESLGRIVRECGPFGIPDPGKFLRIKDTLQNKGDTFIDKDRSVLVIKFLEDKAKVDIPVILNISNDVINNIEQFDYKELKENEPNDDSIIAIGEEAKNVDSLLSKEGSAVYGDALGIYMVDGKIMSYDYNLFLESKKKFNVKDFFIPQFILGCGINDLPYVKINDNTIHLVGPEVQMFFSKSNVSSTYSDLKSLKEGFEKSKEYKVGFSGLTSTVWSRAKIFTKNNINLHFENGEIKFKGTGWEETIGETDLPNAKFEVRQSLLERYLSKTQNRKIAISSEGYWYMKGETRQGLDFYALLSNVTPEKTQSMDEVLEKEPPVGPASTEEVFEGDADNMNPLL